MKLDVAIVAPDVWPLAVQGPKSDDLVTRLFGERKRDIGFFKFLVCEFELVFQGADYFKTQGLDSGSMVSTVVIRFNMTDDQQRYHLPVMLAPHSYSTWWSGQS
jgi:hypothetical protein